MPTLARGIAAVLSIAALTFLPVGCGSTCGSNCPVATVTINAAAGFTIPAQQLAWSGPACPPYRPVCRADPQNLNCTHIDVMGFAEGACDLTIVFGDRPTEIVHIEFGPRVTQGCCAGFTVAGDTAFTVPVDPGGVIQGSDGGTDAVTVIRDAGAGD
jgi:hypothetical protein